MGVPDLSCNKIAEAEAVVSVNEKKWLVMHVHVQLRLVLDMGVPGLCTLVTGRPRACLPAILAVSISGVIHKALQHNT